MGGRVGRHRRDLRQGSSLGAGWQRGAKAQAIGPSRGGQTTKVHTLVDRRPVVIHLTAGNASDVTTAPEVLAAAPGRVHRLIADKGYDADWLRADLRAQGTTAVIPGTRARKRRLRLEARHNRERWRIEATSCRLKNFFAASLPAISSPATPPGRELIESKP